jgi:hypothetical protein
MWCCPHIEAEALELRCLRGIILGVCIAAIVAFAVVLSASATIRKC